ncbi:hypothetical protein AgCh_004994 [Apium graveolens]
MSSRPKSTQGHNQEEGLDIACFMLGKVFGWSFGQMRKRNQQLKAINKEERFFPEAQRGPATLGSGRAILRAAVPDPRAAVPDPRAAR